MPEVVGKLLKSRCIKPVQTLNFEQRVRRGESRGGLGAGMRTLAGIVNQLSAVIISSAVSTSSAGALRVSCEDLHLPYHKTLEHF